MAALRGICSAKSLPAQEWQCGRAKTRGSSTHCAAVGHDPCLGTVSMRSMIHNQLAAAARTAGPSSTSACALLLTTQTLAGQHSMPAQRTQVELHVPKRMQRLAQRAHPCNKHSVDSRGSRITVWCAVMYLLVAVRALHNGIVSNMLRCSDAWAATEQAWRRQQSVQISQLCQRQQAWHK